MNERDNPSYNLHTSHHGDAQQHASWYTWPAAVSSDSQYAQGWRFVAAPLAWRTSRGLPGEQSWIRPPEAQLQPDLQQRQSHVSWDLEYSAGPLRHPNKQYCAERKGHSPSGFPGAGFSACGGAYTSANSTVYNHGAALRNISSLSLEGSIRRVEHDLDKTRNRKSSFRHPSIDFTRRQIRLVRVLQTEPGALIKCKFALSMVDNKSVRYTALSYTWGDALKESDVVKIILHKQEFWARRNLWCFLRQVRDDPGLRDNWYWIDALCIDQAENGADGHREKNHQVNMMSRIYRNADMVTSWLGEPPASEHRALGALQDLLEKKISRKDWGMVRQGLRYLGESSYWLRIWIIQELVLAKEVRFRVGKYELDWDDIYTLRSTARLSQPGWIHAMGWEMTNIFDLRDNWSRGMALDVVIGMRDFGRQKCADPRDKIYGLLGLMSSKPCRADYSKSCIDLYVDVVLWAFEQDLLAPPIAWGGTRDDGSTFCNGRGPAGRSVCGTLLIWSTALGLSETTLRQAHIRLADVLQEDWPLLHPSAEGCSNYGDR